MHKKKFFSHLTNLTDQCFWIYFGKLIFRVVASLLPQIDTAMLQATGRMQPKMQELAKTPNSLLICSGDMVNILSEKWVDIKLLVQFIFLNVN